MNKTKNINTFIILSLIIFHLIGLTGFIVYYSNTSFISEITIESHYEHDILIKTPLNNEIYISNKRDEVLKIEKRPVKSIYLINHEANPPNTDLIDDNEKRKVVGVNFNNNKSFISLWQFFRAINMHFIFIGFLVLCFSLLYIFNQKYIRSKIKKHKKRIKTTETYQAINQIKKTGIKVGGFFMLGFPGESEASIKETSKLARQLPLDYASFNIVSPRFGTELRKNAIAAGYIDSENIMGESSTGVPIWKEQAISNETLMKLKNKAVKAFYMRPKYLIYRTLNINTVHELKMLIREGTALLSKNRLGK